VHSRPRTYDDQGREITRNWPLIEAKRKAPIQEKRDNSLEEVITERNRLRDENERLRDELLVADDDVDYLRFLLERRNNESH